MRILTSTLDCQLEEFYEEFVAAFGFGPCGVYAALRREHDWGQVAACAASRADDRYPFPHYVIVSDGALIDLANPFDEALTYEDIELLPDDELPELVDEDVLAWLRERILAE